MSTPTLQRLFNIQHGESRRVAAMLLYSIAVVGGVIITGQLATRSLFLSELPRSAIPYKFIVPPLVLMFFSAFYTKLSDRFRRDHLIIFTCTLGVLGALAFRLLLSVPVGRELFALCALFVFIDLLGDFAILQFWTFAGDVFDPREAKRLFGLIAGGSTVSNVLFGATLSSSAAAVDPADLLFVIVFSLIVCATVVWYLSRHCIDDLSDSGISDSANDETNASSFVESLRQVLSQPLVRNIAAIVLFVALASTIADYLLDISLQKRYADDGQGIVSFLGSFRFWAGLGAGLLQFFLAGRLLQRFGLTAGLALLPAAMGLGAGAVFLAGGALWAAALPRACDVVLKYTINDAAANLLYLPIDPRLRARAKTIIGGIVKPPLIGLLGVGFLFAEQWAPLSSSQWALILLAVILPWLLLIKPAARQYVQALTHSLQMRQLDLDEEQIDLSDDSSLQVIRRALQSREEGRVLHALSMIEDLDRVDWRHDLLSAMHNASPRIRRVALSQLVEAGGESVQSAIHTATRDPDVSVRAVAVEAISRQTAHIEDAEVAAFLSDADARIRAAAALGFLRNQNAETQKTGEQYLSSLLEAPSPTARIEGIWALRRLAQPDFSTYLLPRLLDPDMGVRLAALRAASIMPAPELISALIPNLTYANLLRETAAAISLCASDNMEPLPSLIDSNAQPTEIRAALIGILPSVADSADDTALLHQLDSRDERLRLAACKALLEFHRRGDDQMQAKQLRAALDAEIRRAYQLYEADAKTAQFERALLLREVLQARLRDTETRILILLDLLYPDLLEERIRPHLRGGERRAHAAALELLDLTLPHELRSLVVPLFAQSEQERGEAKKLLSLQQYTSEEHLRLLRDEEDPWLSQCAHFALGDFRPTSSGDQDMAMSTLERVFFLKSVPLFQPIPGEELSGLASILHEVSFAAGKTFISKGGQADYLYIIVEGEVDIHRGELHFVEGPGQVIGERSVLAQTPRNADCTARTEVVALRVDKDDFWQLMREQPNFTIEVMKVVVDRYVVNSSN